MATALRNCRTCKFAQWHRNAAGRRQYGNWASCIAPIVLPPLPLSITGSYQFIDALKLLTGDRARSVANNDNVPMECPSWEREQ